MNNHDILIKRKLGNSYRSENGYSQHAGIVIKDDNSDDEETHRPFWRESSKPPKIPISDYTKTSPFWRGQNFGYFLILLIVTVFVLISNHYSAKQVVRIKEQFGMEHTAVAPELWFEHALIYNVLVRTFKDTNGDGVGDLDGVLRNVNYFVFLGVDCVLLTGVFESPLVDLGRDVSDFMKVDPDVGTEKDLRNVIKTFHSHSKSALQHETVKAYSFVTILFQL